MFLRQGSAILRAPEGDPAGGGDPGTGDNTDTPAFTEAQQKAMGQLVNQAITSHLKRELPKTFADGLKGVNWKEILSPQLADLLPKTTPEDSEGGKPGKKPNETEQDRRIQQLATELENEKKSRVTAEQARQKAEQDRKIDNGKQKLRSALADKCAAGALDHAIDRLTVVQSRLSVDENGNALFRVRRPEYPGGSPVDVDLSLEDALPILLAEDDMKIYLAPPKGDSGGRNPGPRSNGQIPQYNTPANSDEEKVRRAYEKEQALIARFGNR